MANELKTTFELDIKPFLDAIKRAANAVRGFEEISPKFNTRDFQRLQTEISRFKPEINVAVKVQDKSLEDVQKRINDVGKNGIDVPLDIDIDQINNQLQRVGELRVRVPQTELSRITNQIRNLNPDLNVDFNANRASINDLQAEINELNQNVKLDIIVDDKQVTETSNDIKAVESENIDLQVLVNSEEIQRSINRVRELRDAARAIPPISNLNVESNLDKVIQQVNQITFTADKDLEFDIKFTPDPELERTISKLQEVESKIKSVDSNDANIKVNAETTDVNRKLDLVEKNLNDLPNQKNIKINVDQTGLRNVSQATSSIGGFVGQLGTGLVASFSGAAVGAAIANFATQSVRAIASAADEADGLQDALKLAFTQVGVPEIALPDALQRANQFAFELGDNFGISIQRSQLLLSQVVGLTGEFGNTSESITKAALGIETATAGLVKAETAAKLFSRSIGNPEDQAALETLAKRFPAIGEAIQNATEPAEKANAVIQNLAGTFASLEEQSLGFAENFRLLGEVALGSFAGALAPIFDSFVPLLDELTNLFAENADEIAAFGERIVTDFTEPLVRSLLDIGPQFANFFEGIGSLFGAASQNSFNALTIAIQGIGFALGVLGDLLKIVAPFAQQLSNILATALQPIIRALEGDFANLTNPLNVLTDGLFGTSEATSGLNPLLQFLQNILSVLEPVISDVAEGIDPVLTAAFNALFLAVAPINLILSAINFAFDLGKGLIRDYGGAVRQLTEDLGGIINLLGPLRLVLDTINYISGATNRASNTLGDLSKIGNVPAEAFGEAFDAAENFTATLPKVSRNLGNVTKAAGGAAGGTKDLTTELGKAITAYDLLAKAIGEVNDIKNLQNERDNLYQQQSLLGLGQQRTEYDNLQDELENVNRLEEQRKQTQESLLKTFGIQSTVLETFFNKFNQDISKLTVDAITIPIAIGGTDEERRTVTQKFIDNYKEDIRLQSEKTKIELNIKNLETKINEESLRNSFDLIQLELQNALSNLTFNKIDVGELDASRFIRGLSDIRREAQGFAQPLNDQLDILSYELNIVENRLRELERVQKEGGESFLESAKNADLYTIELGKNQGATLNLTDSIEALNKEKIILASKFKEVQNKASVYNDVIKRTDDSLIRFADTIEDTVIQSLRRLADRSDFELNIKLNSEDINPGLIQIERDFNNSVRDIEAQFAASAARLRVITPVGPLQQEQQLADAQKNILNNLKVEREIAIRQFNEQNNVFFAINESLRKNLANVLSPDTSQAKKALDERKKGLDSELELLKTNLELGIISYQDYNSRVLELEREKTDAIKQFDDEVKETRLNNLKQIAEDALPALNNQLTLSQAELSVTLQSATATFTDVANQGLETIGVIAAQSLAIAVQQAKSLEEIEKLFVKNVINGILRVLQAELVAASLRAIFKEGAEKGPLGLITGALLGGAFAALFAAAEAKLVALLGYEQGGYTGDGGRKEVAGVVHGQEFVVNADATKKNRPVLEWLNKTNGTFEQYIAKTSKETLTNEKFSVLNEQVMKNFDNRLSNIELQVADKNALNVNNYIDTKSMSSSINGLAYTMDSRLASLETTVDKAIRQNATLTKSANQLDVSVFADPGTTLKYAKKIGKIKGLS